MMPFLQPIFTLLLVVLKVSAQNGYIYQPQLLSPQYYSPPSLAAFYPTVSPPRASFPQPQPRIISSSNTNRGNLAFYNQLNFGLPVLDNNYISNVQTYTVDGRVLKQYLVEEPLDDILPPDDIGSNPALLSDFANIFEKYARINQANRRVNQDFVRIQVSNGRTSVIQPVTRNHGPVALGSGSLGYIRRPNGSVFLGSGSLGYISNQQRVNDVNDARAPKGTAPGPTSFGDGAFNPFI